MAASYVRLYRRLLGSQVYRDVNCRLVFLHLMLTCDDEGNATTTIRKLAEETGLTRHQVDLAVRKLLKKGSIAYSHVGQHKGQIGGQMPSVITLCHYVTYQKNGKGDRTKDRTITPDNSSGDKESQSLKSRAERMVAWWNEVCVPKFEHRRPVSLTAKRLRQATTRLRENGWAEAFRKCADYLPIPNDDNFQWQPDLDWFLSNDSNVYKVIEGRYVRTTRQERLKGLFDE